VGELSGGERNRVHLAKLLRNGSNVLLLDEPTNDLDVDTLRALEEALLQFAGCVVVISHDRWFLDRIATHMLAFEGESQVVWFEGNYQDYEADRHRRLGTAADQPHRITYRKLTRRGWPGVRSADLQVGPVGFGACCSIFASKEPVAETSKRKTNIANAWAEARELVWAHRSRLALGLLLMLINRLAGLVLPTTSKFLIDDVIGRGRADLLMPLALAAGAATLVDATTAFALSQVLGVAAQRAIANMRMSLQRHITRLPTSYFDSTQTGVLISRVMNDADGIRNLVGSGLVQLVGGLVTAVIALGVLFYLNWQLTLLSIVVLAVFAAGMIIAFGRLRPLFRDRGKITAEISGRLAESFGGIRVVKA
jgi:ABC-type bacteriocin/lantibiotic exporter with double-glycine peptidase domain